MIKKNLLKGAAVLLACCLVFAPAGCGKKKPVSTENTSKAVAEQETKDTKKTKEEQVTIAVKDAEGNTVEVAGIVETNEDGEKVVIIQDRDGNRTEIKADNYEESAGGTITITDETVSNEITEAAKDDKIPKADEVIPTKPSTNEADNNSNNNSGSNSGGSSSDSSDNNNGGNSSGNNGGNTTPSEPETKPSTPDTPSHEHNWEPIYDYIPHEEVKENVWVVDKAAWEEPVYGYVDICLQCENGECSYCNEHGLRQAEFDSFEDSYHHMKNCALNGGSCRNSTRRKKIIDYIHHDEEGHYETVTISEAYTEKKLVGYRCSSCGETKSN